MSASTNWGRGYPTHLRYLDTAQADQAPAAIDMALLLASRKPPRRGGRFRYADLGCGTAFTTIGLAALHPEAEFLGVDFMPEHVAMAREMIAEAGLTNIEVIEASFADLAAAAPPEPFDYVVMHGVWAWVTEPIRQDLIRLLSQWVAPGGVLYNGYSAAAGWFELLPLRMVFLNAALARPLEGAAAGRAAVDAWLEASGRPTRTSAIWDRLSRMPDQYLMHDLGAPEATAFWPAEVAGALADAKLDYIAPVTLRDQFDLLCFDPKWEGFLQQADGQGWGDAARDIALRRTFRTDLFGRGTVRLTRQEQHQALRAQIIAPWPPLLQIERRPSQEDDRGGLGPDVAARIEAASGGGPLSVADFVEASGLQPMQGLQIALLALAQNDWACVADAETEAAQRDALAPWHAAMARRRQAGHPVPGVMSPVLSRIVPLSAGEMAAAYGGEAPPAEAAAGVRRIGLG